MTRCASFVNYSARCVIAVKRKVRHMCVMAKDDPHFRLRLPVELKLEIEKAAKDNNRSINAEIISRLEDASSAGPLMKELLELLESANKRERESLEIMKWFREQQDGFNAVIDMIAEGDGVIDPKMLSLIRIMVSNRGKNTGFPVPKDD